MCRVAKFIEECSLYTNARMQSFMNITPYTVISIETLLFGFDNLTNENNLIVFRNVQKYKIWMNFNIYGRGCIFF
jgi:hypothetical protein